MAMRLIASQSAMTSGYRASTRNFGAWRHYFCQQIQPQCFHHRMSWKACGTQSWCARRQRTRVKKFSAGRSRKRYSPHSRFSHERVPDETWSVSLITRKSGSYRRNLYHFTRPGPLHRHHHPMTETVTQHCKLVTLRRLSYGK